jgi:DNA-binding response OmpR family regulator
MSYRLLLVQPDEDELLSTRDVLVGGGYAVDVVRTFEEAVHRLADDLPDLLVTGLRLGKYNGLHLVFRSRILHPTLPSLVTGSASDRSSEIDRLGIRYLTAPAEHDPLLEAVGALLADRQPRAAAGQRRWPRKHVHLPAIISDSNVEVIELSYGGLRLEGVAPAAGVGTPIAINFPTLGLSVTAVARWTKPVQQGAASWCGAEIMDDERAPAAVWRGVVDSVN